MNNRDKAYWFLRGLVSSGAGKEDIVEIFTREFGLEWRDLTTEMINQIQKDIYGSIEDAVTKNENRNRIIDMKLNDRVGFKRLARLMAILTFFVIYIILYSNERIVSGEEALIQFPIISLIVAISVYILIRSIYWVADGFLASKKNDNENK